MKHPVSVSHISGWVTYYKVLLWLKEILLKKARTEYSRILLYPGGEPTGTIESALCPIFSKIPMAAGEEFIKGLEIVSGQYAAKGCTTSQEGWLCSEETVELALEVMNRNLFRLRLVLYPVGEGAAYEAGKDELYPGFGSGEYWDEHRMLCMGTMKLTADDSIQARTAFLLIKRRQR